MSGRRNTCDIPVTQWLLSDSFIFLSIMEELVQLPVPTDIIQTVLLTHFIFACRHLYTFFFLSLSFFLLLNKSLVS